MPVTHKGFGRKMVNNDSICLRIMLNINLKSNKNKYHYKKYLKYLNLNHIINKNLKLCFLSIIFIYMKYVYILLIIIVFII
jgi:hypothetical protein